MSFTSWTHITFARRGGSNLNALQVWLSEGWSLDNSTGGISAYQEDSDGYPERFEASLDEPKALMSRLSELDALSRYFAVEISWEHSDTVVSVGFNGKTDPHYDLGIGIVSGRRLVADYYELTDHSWYFERLLIPLLERGWSMRNLEWHDSA